MKKTRKILVAHGVLAMVIATACCAVAGEVVLQEKDGKVYVTAGGAPFAEYVHEGLPKPSLYPVIGPDGIPMTRNYPFKKVEGEASDHPHHQSLWYCHGNVNGVDFWSVRESAGKIRHAGELQIKGATISGKREWVTKDGKIVCTDDMALTFGEEKDGTRWIEYAVAIHASQGELTFGDTKEGTMAIRTHPGLRLKNDPKHGVTTANGHALNSAGNKDRDLWGKRAKWVDYWGTIDGKTVGVAIFDHPENPRHPTWWHARDYGLIAANPFGLSYFERKEKGAGNMKVEKGESVAFRYRFLFHRGDAAEAKTAERYAAWSGE